MINGISGCEIKIVDDKLYKIPTNYSSKRLIKQGKKQSSFGGFRNIKAPKVHIADSSGIVMDYHRAFNFIQFFSVRPPKEVIDRFETILDFIEDNVSLSLLKDKKDAVLSKVSDLTRKLNHTIMVDIPEVVEIPEGYCHGDLTLSNVLFEKSDIVFIDFLDSFVDSPLIDIVKLRQDTYFKWSLDLFDGHYDSIRIDWLLGILDNRIASRFIKYDWYCENYKLFQQINLMRILPYADEQHTKKIKQHLNNSGLWRI
jgi:hypothetical protein